MKLSELRPGNWVNGFHGADPYDHGYDIQQLSIEDLAYLYTYADGENETYVRPIKLTKEELIELIFNYCSGTDMWFSIRILNDWTMLLVNPKHSMAEISINKHSCVLNFDGNLHSLQNLYFALTGEELVRR